MNVLTVSNPYTDTEFLTQEVSHVWSVAEIIKGLVPPVTTTIKKQNTRKDLLNELYQQYLQACNKEYYWKNKKRCYAFIKLHHPGALKKKEEYNRLKDVFRKAKLPQEKCYLKPYSEQEHMWYKRFNKSKEWEIREMISNARSIDHRKGNIIAYILKEEKFIPENQLSHEKQEILS